MTTGVVVDFSANLARFTSSIDKATNDLNKFQSNAQRISGNIKGSFAALGVGLSVTGFVAFIKHAADAQDKLNDLSKATRISVEDLAGLSLASKKSGSDLDATAKAINKLAQEMGKDADKFKQLGINAKSPLEAFGQLADVMNAIEDPQKRAAVGAIALGKAWEEAAPLMAEGSKSIREMIKQGTELSKVTTASAKAADEFNDKWEDLTATLGGWGIAVANPVIDGIMKIGKALELEIKRKPGSIAEFLLGPKQGYTGELDQYGLPKKQGATAAPPAEAGKPSATAIDRFIGGGSGGARKALSDLDKALAEQKKRIAELNALAGDEQLLSVDTVSRQYDKVLEDRAAAMDELHMQRMEMYRIETEGEEAVREAMDKTNSAVKEANDFARDLGLSFSSAFEDAVVGGKKFSDVLKGLGTDIARIITRKSITEPLGNAATSLLGKIDFRSLFGFASGGAFTVGGSGGTDSQLVAFKATPGEEVSVRTPSQQNRGGTTNNFSVDMRGASVEAVSRLEQLVMSVNGSIERRALNVMAQSRVRGA